MKRGFLCLLVWASLSSLALNANEPLYTENRMIRVEGRPRFLLGLYENPTDDARLRQAVDAGFNLIRCRPDQAALDRLHRFGVKAWITLSHLDLSQDPENRRPKLLDVVKKHKTHPALLIWEGPDEALWNNWWLLHSYLEGKEFPQMRQLMMQKTDLRKRYEKMVDFKSRGLWPEFDAARAAFWAAAKKPLPRPDIRLAELLDQARRRGEGLTAGITAVKQVDPAHPVWLNHAPRNSLKSLRFYNRAADMAGCDIYPVPANLLVGHSDLPNTLLSSVGDFTERMRRAAPGRPCAMVLQGFGWRDLNPLDPENSHPSQGRRPTFRESRFMAYNAILHGANALLYWGTNYAKDEIDADASATEKKETLDTPFWRDLRRVIRELSTLEPALAAPPVRPQPDCSFEETFGSVDDRGLMTMLKKVDGDYVLLVTNETHNGLAFTVSNLPAELEGKTLYCLNRPDKVQIVRRGFRDGIPAFEARIYATSRRFEPTK